MKHIFLVAGLIGSLGITAFMWKPIHPLATVRPSSGYLMYTTDTTLAHRITQKLTDSLSLDSGQRINIHAVNCWVDSCKLTIVNQYQGSDSFNIWMDIMERFRDSCFQTILTDSQFVQYGQRKNTLVLNN